jgi:hypothetical protein
VDDPPVRGLRLGGGDEPALPYLLERGQTGLSVAFDLPTQLGYDSDDKRAAGEVGRTGVAIDSLADMELVFDGIPLDQVSTSMTIKRAGLASPPALRAGRGEAGRREANICAGLVQNDILKEYIARGNYIFPPRPSMRLTTDLFAYCAERLPYWNTISISGYHIREAGLDRGPGARFHARERDRLLPGSRRCGPVAGRVRRAPLVLLQRAQPLLPGDREVSRGASALGGDHARPVRRDEREGAGAPLPRADGRLDADRATA